MTPALVTSQFVSDTQVALSDLIAAHIAKTCFDDLPASTVAATKRSLVDGLGVMLAASSLGEGIEAFQAMADVCSRGEQAILIGTGRRAPLSLAALANGALSHALDFEDSYDGAPVHPNAVALAATLSLADAHGSVSGKSLLAALAVGCDLVCRLGLALRCDPTSYGWYTPPILGAFGAVAACAKLVDLSPAQIKDAFSLLLCSHTCSAEIKYSPDSHIRAIRDAFPAQAAVQAVRLAGSGIRGFDAPFEGKAGLFAMYARGEMDLARLTGNLGREFEGDRVSYKPWPSCRGTHPFIEAVLKMREAGLTADQVESIQLFGHPVLRMLDEPRDTKRAPSTAIDAKFSLAFTVAAALIDGEITLGTFDAARLSRPDIAALAQRVSVTIRPDHPQDGLVSGGTLVTTRAGEKMSREIDQALGHPANPMSDEQIHTKFRICASLAADRPDNARIEAMIATIETIDQEANIGVALFGAHS